MKTMIAAGKRTDSESCDSLYEHPAGSWLICSAKGPHSVHFATEAMGRTHRWTDAKLTPSADEVQEGGAQ